jgi:hypothetical protein
VLADSKLLIFIAVKVLDESFLASLDVLLSFDLKGRKAKEILLILSSNTYNEANIELLLCP